MKRTALLRAILLPAAIVVGVAGSALATAPANAAEPVPNIAPALPTGTPAPSDSPTAAPNVASPVPSAAEPTIASTATPTVAPSVQAGVSPAPADLIVTSPTDGQEIHGTPRTVDVVGRAPVGATITVSDYSGHVLASGIADATGSFTITLQFALTDSYDQYLVVTGTSRGKDLTEQDVEVLFDADVSTAPVLTSPVSGTTVAGTPAPFADPSAPFTITVTGDAKPGDWVYVEADPSGASQDSGYGWSQMAEADAQGHWSTVISVGAGRWSVTAYAQQFTPSGDPLTHESDPAAPSVVLVSTPPGYVAAPVITAPAYPDASSTETGTAATSRLLSSTVTTQHFEATAGSRPTLAGAQVLRHLLGETTAGRSGATAQAGDFTARDSTDPSFDDIVRQDGIQVTGKPDPALPGNVRMTVSGTGAPGQGVQLYLNTASKAFVYFEGLYPDYFRQFGFDPSGVPATTPPADDGTITVAVNGTWTTTVSIPAGPYFLTAFGVDRGAATPALSLAGAVVAVNLTAAAVTPAVVPGEPAQPTLAATGLETTVPLSAAVLLLAAGAAVLTVSARRRRCAKGAPSAVGQLMCNSLSRESEGPRLR